MWRSSADKTSVLVVAFAHKAAHHTADKACGDARRGSGQPAGQDADGTLFRHGGAHPLCQQMPKAQQGQLLIDLTKLTPARILTGYVVAGVVLSAVGLYAPLAEFAGAGASVPLLGFGHEEAWF